MKREIISDILQLSVAERLQLVEEIWESIADVPEALELPEPQQAELERRIAEYRIDPSIAISWVIVQERIGL